MKDRVTHYLGYVRRCSVKGCDGWLTLEGENYTKGTDVKAGVVCLTCTNSPEHKRTFPRRWFDQQYRIVTAAEIIRVQGGLIVRDARCPFCGAPQRSSALIREGEVFECGGGDEKPCGARFVAVKKGLLVCTGLPV